MTAVTGGRWTDRGPQSPQLPPEGSETERRAQTRGCPVLGRSPAGSVTSVPAPSSTSTDAGVVDVDEAEEFLRQFHAEQPQPAPLRSRLEQVRAQIATTGTYEHTPAELAFGARVAWRNSARCIGRLYWNSLHIRDRRSLMDPRHVAAECVEHLRESTRDGRIRSTITVFAPDRPGTPGPRIVNEQLIRYAGYPTATTRVSSTTAVEATATELSNTLGDPRTRGLTATAIAHGWQPPVAPGPFDVLPLLVADADGHTVMHPLPQDAVLEVALTHPDYGWFTGLGLRWHAVPAISDMTLHIGGITYPAAPFNGYYLGTEIGARNLADTDRYDMLPAIAERLDLDTSSDRTLWKDRALVELVRAVHHSFDQAGVSMADHHTESERFLTHLAREQRAGRTCPTDWSWIVPPMSASTTPVFHRYYDPPEPHKTPAFRPRWR